MDEDLLQAVVSVESSIQQSLESEREKAAQWLESVRSSLSRDLETKRRRLEDEYTASLATTRSQCELEARNAIDEIERMAENLAKIPDNDLEDVVMRFLPAILPKKMVNTTMVKKG